MTSHTSSTGTAVTGAISATAVLSATGFFAAPAEASASGPTERQHHEAAAAQIALSPGAVERALAPAASAVVIDAAPSAAPAAKSITHTVVRGDTVWDLARHYGSTVTAIIDANGLDSRATIHVGDRLSIPGAQSASKGSAKKAVKKAATHTVRSGDTVWDLAQRYDSTVSAIVSANHLGADATIHVGDRLTIPGAKASATTKPAKASGGKAATAASRYTVKRGDTVSAIAHRFGATVRSIAAANGLDDPSRISVGQVLTIPGGVPTGLVGDTFAGRTYPKDVVSAANANKAILNDRPVPTRAHMRNVVERTAKRYGVDVSLALAISYQESGFNMRAVSPANAVGAMQVIPSTGEWVSTMVGRPLDLLDPEDNVTAGVALLSYLTRNAGSLDQAIAGYYQGLAGVRKHGMNPDTKQYVASVRALMKKFD